MASKTAKKSAVTAPKAERPKLTAAEAIREIRNLRNASPRGAVQNMEYVDLLLSAHDELARQLLVELDRLSDAAREAARLEAENVAAQKEIKRLGELLTYAESRLENIISGS